MDADQKVRLIYVLVSATIPVFAAMLATHGLVISPLDEIGGGPH